MPDNTVSFRLTVEGAPEGAENINRVRTALTGVETSLDRHAASSGRADIATRRMGEAQKQAAILYSASGQAISHAEIQAGTSSALLSKEIEGQVKAAVAGDAAHSRLGQALRSGGQAAREHGQHLSESTRLMRSLVDTVVGDAVPGLGAMLAGLSAVTRETNRYGIAAQASIIGIELAATALGRYVLIQSKLADSAAATVIAKLGGDFGAATGQITAATNEFLRLNQTAGDVFNVVGKLKDIPGAVGEAFTLAIGGDAAGAMARLSEVTFSTSEAARAASGVFKLAMTSQAAQVEILLDKISAGVKTWNDYGKAAATIQVVTGELAAEAAQLENVKKLAATPEALGQAYEKQAEAIRKASQQQAEKIESDHKAATASLELALILATAAGKGAEAAAYRKALDEARALTARQVATVLVDGETKATAATLQGAQASAAARAQESTDAGKLIEIKGRIATEAIRASQAEIDARMAVAKADADFFGTSLAGLQQYQAARLASVNAEMATEVAGFDAAQALMREAENRRIAGLAEQDRNTAIRQQVAAEAEAAGKRLQIVEGYAQRVRAIELTTTQERRANYARDVALVAATYAQEEALGQGDLAAKLNFLRQQGQNENLNLQQKRQYQLQAYTEARALDEALAQYHQTIGATTVAQDLARLRALADAEAAGSVKRIVAEQAYVTRKLAIEEESFARIKAFGQTTGADEVRHLADLASKYGDNADKRIAAETKWASATLALRQSVADSGKSLISKTIAAMESEGKAAGTYDDVLKRIGEDQKKAATEIDTFTSKGTVDWAKLRKAMDLSADYAKFAKDGVTAGEAVRGGMDDLKNGIHGVQESVGVTAGALRTAGKAGADAWKPVNQAMVDYIREAASAGQSTAQAAQDFQLLKGGARDAGAELKAIGDADVGGQVAVDWNKVKAAVGDTTRAFQIARDEAGNIVSISNDMDTPFAEAKTAALSFGGSMATVEAAGNRAAGAFDGFGTSIPTAMGKGLDGALGLVDGFFVKFEAKVDAGTSRVADRFASNFMTLLQRRLDAESNSN